MKLSNLFPVFGLFTGLALASFPAFGQAVPPACGVAPISATNAHPNIFSAEQEQWLGDAMAEVIEPDVKPMRDPALSAYLQRIVDKLVATLPPTGIRFRVMLVDSSSINGYSIAGGRIYLNRKLVAAAHSEDELAAVLGHEIGHIASHQFAFETTADLKRLLNITEVKGRADIFEKFQKLMDARMQDKHPPKNGDSESGQDEADKVGVYVVAAAGYRPQAFAEFWDRSFYVGGKTGSRLSDFFGLTKPNEKRLRGMNLLLAALPAGCGGKENHHTAEFTSWQAAVVANQAATLSATGAPDTTHDVALKEVQLTPPLRLDIYRLHFSRDGKMMLAQDESSIAVVNRSPMSVLFRLDAENALPAEFSAESTKISFTTAGLHTETWDIGSHKLDQAHEVVTKAQCAQEKLSPDGKTVVCLYLEGYGLSVNLQLIDVATGSVAFEKKNLFEANPIAVLAFLARTFDSENDLVPVHFSPDGKTVLIGPGSMKMAFDLATRTPIKLSGGIRGDVDGDYTFLANDMVAGSSVSNFKNAGVYSFPDGRKIKKTQLIGAAFGNLSQSKEWVMAYGVKNAPSALLNVDNGRIIGLTTPAVDVWDDTMIAETSDGYLATAKMTADKSVITDKVRLPLSPLASSRAISISPDGKYLAMSSRFHGGIWEVESGMQRANLRGFTSAQWGPNDTFYADIPKRGESERHMSKVDLAAKSYKDLPYKLDDKTVMRYGYLLEWKDADKKSADLVMHSPEDNAPLWTRHFVGGATRFTMNVGGGDMIFNYTLQDQTAKDRVKANTTLASEALALKQKDLGRLIEIADSKDGKTLAEVVLELPLTFAGTDGLNRLGDVLFVTSEDNRTMMYSLTTGKQIRQLFGAVIAVDAGAQRICLENRRDEASVYGIDGTEIAHFHLGDTIRFARFSAKGTRLVVLTSDQKMRTMDLTKKEVAAK